MFPALKYAEVYERDTVKHIKAKRNKWNSKTAKRNTLKCYTVKRYTALFRKTLANNNIQTTCNYCLYIVIDFSINGLLMGG